MRNALDILLLAAAAAVFAVGVVRPLRRVALGAAEPLEGGGRGRLAALAAEVASHRRLRHAPQGLHHALLFYAFVTPLLVVILTQADPSLPKGVAVAVSMALEAVAALGVYGLLRLFLRRYVTRPPELESTFADVVAYALLFGIFGTGFLTEGLRLAAAPTGLGVLTPVGFLLSLPLSALGPESLARGIALVWRVHLFLVLFTVALLPYGKFSHVVFGPLNLFFARRGPKGAWKPLDIENSEIFGVGEVERFGRKDLLDLEACVQCGRCQAKCPAHNTGKTLNPRKVIRDLRTNLRAKAPRLLKGEAEYSLPTVGDEGVAEADVWSCTTCRHCAETCPLRIEHPSKIVDMRRHLVLMEGSMPHELVSLNKNLENNFNPWGVGFSERMDWTRRRSVNPPVLGEGETRADVLVWVGCAGAFDDRYQRVAASLVRVLERCGISYAVLGAAEKCCGDPARAIGNEYLFQSMALENIETMNGLGVKKIVTPCPHCLKVLSKDYPQFGGNYEVVHHSRFLADLIAAGRIPFAPGAAARTVTLHDPCYLSRYEDSTAEARTCLASVPGVRLAEMERSGADSFCCGAGGGRMWMEEEGTRINNERAREAVGTGAQVVATACPFCLTMITDGTKALKVEETTAVLDLAEIVERGLA